MRKTYLSKTVSVKGNARKKATARTQLTMPTLKELNAFYQLQKLFSSPIILHHHNKKRTLYIDLDASKEFSFGAHVYHSATDLPTSSDMKASNYAGLPSRAVTNLDAPK